MLTLRKATLADADLLYRWRNDERIRLFSLNPKPISYEHHLIWYKNALKNDDRVMYVILFDNKPVGCIRFDIIEQHAEISIYVDPDQQHHGFGSEALNQAIALFSNTYPYVKSVKAKVLPNNTASHHLFTKLGFALSHYEYTYPL